MNGGKLYHVTPAKNRRWINAQGVRPDKSKGKKHVSYWVNENMLIWAIAHVSKRHNVPTRSIAICAVPNHMIAVVNTKWNGVWTCDHIVHLDKGSWSSASQQLERFKDSQEDGLWGIPF